jgi:hypothetical protein
MGILKPTDRKVCTVDGVTFFVATECYNGTTKIAAEKLASVIPALRTKLKMYDTFNVKFAGRRPNKNQKTIMHGAWYHMSRTAVINPYMDDDNLFETFAHEMIHCEQYNTGLLYHDKEGPVWNGRVVKNKGSTHDRYMSLPWEVEAHARQKIYGPFCKKVYRKIALEEYRKKS